MMLDLITHSEDTKEIFTKILNNLFKVLSEKNNKLYELIRILAIPHQFNKNLSDFIIDELEIKENKASILDDVQKISIISEITRDRYSFHDLIREHILKSWKQKGEINQYLKYSRLLSNWFEEEEFNEYLYLSFACNTEKAFSIYKEKVLLSIEYHLLDQAGTLICLANEQREFFNSIQKQWNLLFRAKLFQTEMEWKKALRIYSIILKKDSNIPAEILIESLIGKGNCLNYLGKPQQAKEILQLANKKLSKLNEPNSYIYMLLALSWSYYLEKEYKQSTKILFHALELNEKIENPFSKAWIYNNLGIVFSNIGNYEKAIRFHESAHEIRESIGDRFYTARSEYNLARIHSIINDWGIAFSLIEKVIDIQEKFDDKEGLRFSYRLIADYYNHKKSYEKAINYFSKSIDIEREIIPREIYLNHLHELNEEYKRTGMKIASEYYKTEINRTLNLKDEHQ